MIYQTLKQYLSRLALPALLCIFLGMSAAQGQNKTHITLSSTEQPEDPEEVIRRYRALYRQHPRRTDILFQLSNLLSRTEVSEGRTHSAKQGFIVGAVLGGLFGAASTCVFGCEGPGTTAGGAVLGGAVVGGFGAPVGCDQSDGRKNDPFRT